MNERLRLAPSRKEARRPSILDTLDDPQIFQPHFRDPNTWRAWRSFLGTCSVCRSIQINWRYSSNAPVVVNLTPTATPKPALSSDDEAARVGRSR